MVMSRKYDWVQCFKTIWSGKRNHEGFKQVNHRLNGFGFKASFISGLMLPLVQMTAYGTYIGVAVLGSYYVVAGVMRSGAVASVYSIYLAN